MAPAASARELNGMPTTGPTSTPTFGAETDEFEPAPPSIPGKAGIDSIIE
jgi:hypothetical protein